MDALTTLNAERTRRPATAKCLAQAKRALIQASIKSTQDAAPQTAEATKPVWLAKFLVEFSKRHVRIGDAQNSHSTIEPAITTPLCGDWCAGPFVPKN